MGVKNTDIVESALRYKGKLRYVFGSDAIEQGSGDCSSFTEYIFNAHGLDIGADTSAQYSQGVPVGRDEIKAGDLIFFKNTYNSGKIDGVSHVGIAINNDEFIHLSSSGCKVSSLSTNYYNEHYLMAKRVDNVIYDGETVSDSTTIATDSTGNDTDLKWWGDIVKVVVIVLVLVGGVALLSLSLLGSVKTPKLDMVKTLVKGGTESE